MPQFLFEEDETQKQKLKKKIVKILNLDFFINKIPKLYSKNATTNFRNDTQKHLFQKISNQAHNLTWL